MSPDEGQEELEEVQAEIKKKDEEVNIFFHTLIPDGSSSTSLEPLKKKKSTLRVNIHNTY